MNVDELIKALGRAPQDAEVMITDGETLVEVKTALMSLAVDPPAVLLLSHGIQLAPSTKRKGGGWPKGKPRGPRPKPHNANGAEPSEA